MRRVLATEAGGELYATADDSVHLDVMPVAGIGEHDLRQRVVA
jgi:hypothetical protein